MADSTYQVRALGALDAAERVFARRGFGQATMREIADEAHMSVAGLYYYLPCKQRALYLSCERAFRQLLEHLDRAVATVATPHEQLKSFVQRHLEFVIRHPNAFRVLLRDMDALQGEDRVAVWDLRRQYFSRAGDLVIAVQQLGPLAVSTRVATAALFGMMNWTPMWYHEVGDDEAARIADQMTQLFLHGVSSPSLAEVLS